MYTIGIPNRQYRRTTQVLGPESADPINYDMVKQDDGFYLFSFPDVDEYGFRDIVMLLKSNGVTTIGADDILTERKIMKLTDLLKEQGSPDENNIIDQLEVALKRWLEDKTPPYDRLDSCERSHHYHEDIKDIVDSFKNPLPSPSDEDKIEKDDEELGDLNRDFDTMEEQKLRRLLTNLIKEANPHQGSFGMPGDPSQLINQIKIKVDILGDEKEVIIDKKGGDLSDVTISWDETWGREKHNVDFELDEIKDKSQAYDEPDGAIFRGVSDIWEFYLEVDLDYNYEDSGNIWEIYWEEDRFHNGLEISKKNNGPGERLANVPTIQEQKLKNNMKLKLKDLLSLQEQNIDSKNPGADPFQSLYDKQNPNDPKAIPGKHFPNTKKIKLKMNNIESEVTIIDWKEGKNQLENVAISWDTTTGTESHDLTFVKDPGGHMECVDMHDCTTEFFAESEDGLWQFILDVNVPENYEESETIIGWDWEELIIQDHPDNEDHLDPEDRSDYDDDPRMDPAIRSDFDDPRMEESKFLREQLQKRAGIIK